MQTVAINNSTGFNTNPGALSSSAKNLINRNITAEKNTINLRADYESAISKALRFQDCDDRIVEQAKNAIAQNQLDTLDNMAIAAECILNFGI